MMFCLRFVTANAGFVFAESERNVSIIEDLNTL